MLTTMVARHKPAMSKPRKTHPIPAWTTCTVPTHLGIERVWIPSTPTLKLSNHAMATGRARQADTVATWSDRSIKILCMATSCCRKGCFTTENTMTYMCHRNPWVNTSSPEWENEAQKSGIMRMSPVLWGPQVLRIFTALVRVRYQTSANLAMVWIRGAYRAVEGIHTQAVHQVRIKQAIWQQM